MLRQWLLNGRRANGLIKRVQTVTVAVTGGTATGTATVLAFDAANTLLVVDGWKTSDATGAAQMDVDVCTLTVSGTTLTITQGSSFGSNICTARVLLVEFWPGVLKSVQFVSMTATPTTITQVDITRAIVLPNGWRYNTGPVSGSSLFNGLFLQATGTQLAADGGSWNAIAACVAEFY